MIGRLFQLLFFPTLCTFTDFLIIQYGIAKYFKYVYPRHIYCDITVLFWRRWWRWKNLLFFSQEETSWQEKKANQIVQVATRLSVIGINVTEKPIMVLESQHMMGVGISG